MSDSPTGPFEGGRVIDLGGRNEIDPAVFVDDDGKAYYIWGQGRTWTTVSGKVKSPGGVHALWLRFSGEGEDVLRLDWFAFE